MALSKNYTAKVGIDIIRNIAEEQENSKLQPTDMFDYLNLAIQTVYKDLPQKFYQDTDDTISVSGDSLDISTLNIADIIKIVDETNGKLIPVGPDEIENLADNPRKQSNIFYYQEGQRIRLYKGDNISSYGTMRIVFFRELELVSAETDYLDVPDRFVPTVLEVAKRITYEKLRISTKKDVE